MGTMMQSPSREPNTFGFTSQVDPHPAGQRETCNCSITQQAKNAKTAVASEIP
jgi:hypothetical protein